MLPRVHGRADTDTTARIKPIPRRERKRKAAIKSTTRNRQAVSDATLLSSSIFCLSLQTRCRIDHMVADSYGQSLFPAPSTGNRARGPGRTAQAAATGAAVGFRRCRPAVSGAPPVFDFPDRPRCVTASPDERRSGSHYCDHRDGLGVDNLHCGDLDAVIRVERPEGGANVARLKRA